MRLDKALQNIVYKLVPGLHTEQKERKRKKKKVEKHFFFCDDMISMSLEKYPKNPNRRYLACPGNFIYIFYTYM